MFSPLMRNRLLSALTGTPDVLDALLGSLGPHSPRWDARPDPARFTLREIVAHLADYEVIWLERVTRTRGEANPLLVRVDPAVLADENDYAHSDALMSLARFRERRAALVDFLSGLAEDEWQRVGQMAGEPLTLEEQAAFVVIHDGYHTGQVAQWLAAGREPDRAASG